MGLRPYSRAGVSGLEDSACHSGKNHMSEATLYNREEGGQSQLGDHYLWETPGKGLRIYASPERVDLLQTQVLSAAEPLPKGGVEVGGILLGRTQLGGGYITAFIDDFEPVRCAYRKGPQYSFTVEDAGNFEEALARCESDTTRGLSVIGYYRSHNRDDLYLSADDLDLIQHLFSAQDKVFLIIKTLPIRACTAGFFFWEGARIQSEFTQLEVPLGPLRSQCSTSPRPATMETLEELLALLASPTERDLKSDTLWPAPQSVSPNSPGPDHRRQQALAVVAVILVILGVVAHQTTKSPIARDRIRLSPPITNPEMETVPVEKAGALQDDAPNPTALHHTRIESPKRKNHEPVSEPRVSEQGVSESSQALVPLVEQALVPLVEKDRKVEPAPLPPAEPNITEPIVAPKAVSLPALAQIEQPAPPAEIRVPEKKPITNFTGPQIIYRATPAVPQELRLLITGEVQIDVAVTIDREGKVTGADVTSTRGAAAKLVAEEAVRAARRFRFRPARENDSAVPSGMVLTFRFRRTGG
jgi:TonB family protein